MKTLRFMKAQRPVQGHMGLMTWEGNEDLEKVDHCISENSILHLYYSTRLSTLASMRFLLPI